MSSYIRLKQHISTDFKNNRFILDVQSLLDENEKYRKVYAAFKSCQHIAGIDEKDNLAEKITEYKKNSDVLKTLLNTTDRLEALKLLDNLKKEKNLEE
jgi:hypothetical protein